MSLGVVDVDFGGACLVEVLDVDLVAVDCREEESVARLDVDSFDAEAVCGGLPVVMGCWWCMSCGPRSVTDSSKVRRTCSGAALRWTIQCW